MSKRSTKRTHSTKRTCTTCGETRDLTEFSYSPRAQRWDSYCRACRAHYVRTRRVLPSEEPARRTLSVVRTSLKLPEDLHDWLRASAQCQGITLSELLLRTLQRYRSVQVVGRAVSDAKQRTTGTAGTAVTTARAPSIRVRDSSTETPEEC